MVPPLHSSISFHCSPVPLQAFLHGLLEGDKLEYGQIWIGLLDGVRSGTRFHAHTPKDSNDDYTRRSCNTTDQEEQDRTTRPKNKTKTMQEDKGKGQIALLGNELIFQDSTLHLNLVLLSRLSCR